MSAPQPYWTDDRVQLYLGDCREILPALGVTADCVIADPPYGETSLAWDKWPEGWLDVAAQVTNSLWCFGSMRMFLRHQGEFAGWKLSQDAVWAKPARAGVCSRDRFSRAHENITHWYRGPWASIFHETPRVTRHGPGKGTIHRGQVGPAWNGSRRAHTWTDDGTRGMLSVLQSPTMRLRGIHPTEKPAAILDPLIAYACPPGGRVVDMFAGSASTLITARMSGRPAIGIEADEACCEQAAKWLAQGDLFGGEVA